MEPLGIDLLVESVELEADVAVADPDEAFVAVAEVPEGPFHLRVDTWLGNGWF